MRYALLAFYRIEQNRTEQNRIGIVQVKVTFKDQLVKLHDYFSDNQQFRLVAEGCCGRKVDIGY